MLGSSIQIGGTPSTLPATTFTGNITMADTLSISTPDVIGDYFTINARNTGVGLVEVAGVFSANDPYFSMGGSQEFKFYESGVADLGGFASIGSGAPRIAMKKLSGTTDADSETTVTHGLTLSKILSVSIIVVGSSVSVAPNYFTTAETNHYAYHINATNIVMTSVQAGVQNKAYTILIIYEE